MNFLKKIVESIRLFFVTAEKLNKMQKEIDKLFRENNHVLNDEILNKQIKVNELRNKKNIPDSSEEIYENFVQ